MVNGAKPINSGWAIEIQPQRHEGPKKKGHEVYFCHRLSGRELKDQIWRASYDHSDPLLQDYDFPLAFCLSACSFRFLRISGISGIYKL